MSALQNPFGFSSGWPSSVSSEAEPRLDQYSQQGFFQLERAQIHMRQLTRVPAGLSDLDRQNILVIPARDVALVPPQRPTIAHRQSEEFRWLTKNPNILAQHQGEWLLIAGDELLAHSRDFNVIRETIRERAIRSPFVYYVPTQRETNFVSI
jgi:Family of unknown function (DUF5678)